MTTKLVWFGNFEFGYFDKSGDKYPCVLVHKIDEKVWVDESEIEDYMAVNNHDSWMIPEECKGFEIFYTKTFMKELSL